MDWTAVKSLLAGVLEAASPGSVTVRIGDPGPVKVLKDRLVYRLGCSVTG